MSAPALYADQAGLYDRIYADDDYYSRSAAFVLDLLPPSPSVLDVCAGTGTHARLLAAAGALMTLVDRSPQMLEIARGKVPAARVVCTDVRRLTLRERFDAVLCLYGAVHYLEAPDDVARVLAVAHEHLVPGGRLVFELRDHDRLSPVPLVRRRGSFSVATTWAPADDADVYVVSAVDLESGAHFLDVHRLYNTDPAAFVQLAADAGFVDIELRAGYDSARYAPGIGGDSPVLVARRV